MRFHDHHSNGVYIMSDQRCGGTRTAKRCWKIQQRSHWDIESLFRNVSSRRSPLSNHWFKTTQDLRKQKIQTTLVKKTLQFRTCFTSDFTNIENLLLLYSWLYFFRSLAGKTSTSLHSGASNISDARGVSGFSCIILQNQIQQLCGKTTKF